MSPDPLDTLELLHGQQDAVLPVRLTQQVYVGLMAPEAEVTCDIASSVGHGLHPGLITQAFHRLQTGVPLRFGRSA
jgi:phospholipase/carboxylesterase